MSSRPLAASERSGRIKAILALLALLAHVTPVTATERPNPFTGTSAAFEQKLRQLEEKKLDAAIANEELAVEKANQERLRLRTGRLPGLMNEFEPRKSPTPHLPIPVVPMASPPSSKAVRLVGTVSTPSGWIALIEAEGRVASVHEGESVTGIKVTAIGRETATLNGVPTTLQAVLGRVDVPAAPTKMPSPVASTAVPIDVMDLARRPETGR